jgi:hypothetical protein
MTRLSGKRSFVSSAVKHSRALMTTHMKHIAALLALIHIARPIAGAAPSLPGLFSKDMVLQRDKPIPV